MDMNTIKSFARKFVLILLLWSPNSFLNILLKLVYKFPNAHCVIKSILLSKRRYKAYGIKLNIGANDCCNKCIVFVDNCYGGITDCFKSMISLYDFCMNNGCEFKIHKKKPFDFERFFKPSKYNWHLSDEDYKKMDSQGTLHLWLSTDTSYLENTWQYQQNTINFIIKSELFCCVMIHYSAPHKLSSNSFKTLFTPSLYLQKELDYHKNKLGNGYISVSLRFVNLLGDSNEKVYGYKSLDSEEQQGLIDANLSVLKKLIGINSNKKFLVTSDSFGFISAVEGALLDNVYFIKGSEVHHHIAFSDNVSDKEVTKSYVEFMLISESVVAYQIQIGPMYESKFPKWAACVNNVPYYLIRLSDIGDIDSDLTPISVSYY